MKSWQDWSVASRLSAVVGLIVVALMIAAVGILDARTSRYERAAAHQQVTEQVNSMIGLVEVFDESLAKSLEPMARLFEGSFAGAWSLDTSVRIATGSGEAPALRTADRTINGESTRVDGFTRLTGVRATVFARDGDEFVRVSTSLTDTNGERVLGTRLAHDHPAYAAIIAGQSYSGPATLFGREYETRYDPLLDPSGTVIGIRYVGIDVSSEFNRLLAYLKATKVGQNGYLFILDASPEHAGRMRMHPHLEGQNVLDALSADGQAINRQMLEQRQGEISYDWRGPGEPEARHKLTTFAEYAPRQWIVAASAFTEDFERVTQAANAVMAVLAVALVILIALILWAMTRRFVTRPLHQLEGSLRELSHGEGDLTYRIAVRGDNEIGRLSTEFNAFLARLQGMIRNAASLASEVDDASAALSEQAERIHGACDRQNDASTSTAAAVEEMAVSIASVACAPASMLSFASPASELYSSLMPLRTSSCIRCSMRAASASLNCAR